MGLSKGKTQEIQNSKALLESSQLKTKLIRMPCIEKPSQHCSNYWLFHPVANKMLSMQESSSGDGWEHFAGSISRHEAEKILRCVQR